MGPDAAGSATLSLRHLVIACHCQQRRPRRQVGQGLVTQKSESAQPAEADPGAAAVKQVLFTVTRALAELALLRGNWLLLASSSSANKSALEFQLQVPRKNCGWQIIIDPYATDSAMVNNLPCQDTIILSLEWHKWTKG